ncbi:MAG: F0F1 ATP synthase subunit delta [Steroidobacteraceae bacterium]
MLLDWFTVGAQALNFLILVWLLKRLLYKPILAAIDARERRIARELAEAATKQTEADRQRDEFLRKNEEFNQQRTELLAQSTAAANAEGRRLIAVARQAADGVSAERQLALQSALRNLDQALRTRTQQEVFAIAAQALRDLATANLNDCMVDTFTQKVRNMDAQAKAILANAIQTSTAPAIVRSAFELPPEQHAAIQNALNQSFSTDMHLRFQTAPDLIAGIELESNGQKVAWNIADYLASLEQSLEAVVKTQVKHAG